jgi:hypothetical protein
MNSMRRYTSIGVTAGVIAGGALGFGFSTAGSTSAGPGQSSSTPAPVHASASASASASARASTRATPSHSALAPTQIDAEVEDADPPIGPPPERREQMRAHWDGMRTHIDEIRSANAARLAERLAPLVTNGTLTQQQVDAIVSHLQADHIERASEMRTKMAERFGELRSHWGPRP